MCITRKNRKNSNIETIKERLAKRKAKRLFFKKLILCIAIITVIMIFLLKSPLFKITEIVITGNDKINSQELQKELNQFIGTNIFTLNRKLMYKLIYGNAYVKTASIKIEDTSRINIKIVEEQPAYFLESNGYFHLITNDFKDIGQFEVVDTNCYVQIYGVDLNTINSDNNIDLKKELSEILNKFYPYITKNKESIKFLFLDISDIYNIKGKIGDIDIYLGDIKNLHDKIKSVYNIILSPDINIKKGYINVSFDGPPIIKKEEVPIE